MPKKFKKLIWIIVVCFIAFIIIRAFLGRAKKPQAMLARPVEIALAIEKDAPIYIESFGSLYSPNDVDIKAQVTGQIKEIKFNEGQEVKKGDPLFIIDPAPYKAKLDRAQASLIEDAADLELKKITLERNQKLFEKQLISKQDFDKYQTDVAMAEGKVKLDKADIELEKINLEYCYIVAPVDGLTGKRQVDLGNIVSANTGPTLVNMQAIDALYIDFTISETELSRVRKAMQDEKLKVEIYFDEYGDKLYFGDIELLDNKVDNTTGTILLRGIIPNAKRDLWSGQFAQVRLILGVQNNAVLIPYEAVQTGQKGSYVFIVTKDNKAELRVVKIGNRQRENIVIEDGIKAGEKVVIVGQLGLSPGFEVMDVTGQKNEK
ncbi:MAG: efflux RND transporter periplasmic adaptor subunit [Candidatus Omnitrophota bacterium]